MVLWTLTPCLLYCTSPDTTRRFETERFRSEVNHCLCHACIEQCRLQAAATPHRQHHRQAAELRGTASITERLSAAPPASPTGRAQHRQHHRQAERSTASITDRPSAAPPASPTGRAQHDQRRLLGTDLWTGFVRPSTQACKYLTYVITCVIGVASRCAVRIISHSVSGGSVVRSVGVSQAVQRLIQWPAGTEITAVGGWHCWHRGDSPWQRCRVRKAGLRRLHQSLQISVCQSCQWLRLTAGPHWHCPLWLTHGAQSTN